MMFTRNFVRDEINEQTLNEFVTRFVREGYRVTSQTDTSIQLVKQKKFSCLIATILFLFFAIPFFIYLFMYMGKKEKTIYIKLIEGDEPYIRITGYRFSDWIVEKRPEGKPKQEKLKRRLPVWAWIILVIAILAMLFIALGFALS
jgi:Mn2+/Fe2+ NRAMP family transporter